MEITEVRIKLMDNTDDRLRAFCSITFDNSFVVRDLKIIDGSSGPFVAMPSRKLTAHCPRCGFKNHLKAPYCNHCGDRLREDRLARDSEGRTKLYADIAHPINSACRETIQQRVIVEFQMELERAKQPGYQSRYDDDYDYDDVEPANSNAIPVSPIPTVETPASEAPTAYIPAPHLVPVTSQRESDVPPPHIMPRKEAETLPQENATRGRPNFGSGILD